MVKSVMMRQNAQAREAMIYPLEGACVALVLGALSAILCPYAHNGHESEDRYGDIEVDTQKAHEAYKEWMQMTRPAPGPDGTRRPSWFDRPLRPVAAAYKLPPSHG